MKRDTLLKKVTIDRQRISDYLRMGSLEEERHVFPNAYRADYIVVHTGSIYIKRTFSVKSELKVVKVKKVRQTLLRLVDGLCCPLR